jgi:hypothetical protein
MALTAHKNGSLDAGAAMVAADRKSVATVNDYLGCDEAVGKEIPLAEGNVTPQLQTLIPAYSGIARLTVVSVDTNDDSAVQEFLVINTGEGADGITALHQAGVVGFLATDVIIDSTNLVLRSQHTTVTHHRVFFQALERPSTPA